VDERFCASLALRKNSLGTEGKRFVILESYWARLDLIGIEEYESVGRGLAISISWRFLPLMNELK